MEFSNDKIHKSAFLSFGLLVRAKPKEGLCRICHAMVTGFVTASSVKEGPVLGVPAAKDTNLFHLKPQVAQASGK
jgi:hypothetical protein